MSAGRFAAPSRNVRRQDRSRDIDAEVRVVTEAERSVHERACDTARRLIQARYGNGSDDCMDTLQMPGLPS